MSAVAVETNQYLAESGHWYHPDGSPAYTVIGKNGKRRKTTLRDGKAMGLLPSVTTILGVLDKPGLNRWRENLIVEHTNDTPRILGESNDAYVRRIFDKHKKISKDAADAGTRIHAVLEDYFGNERKIIRTASEQKMLDKVIETEFTIAEDKEGWEFETPLVNLEIGYAGKTDKLHRAEQIVLDYKTKDFDDPDKVKGYPEQAMQLGAYARAAGFTQPRLINLFISRDNPGLVKIIEHDDAARWMKAFDTLATYFRLVRGMDT